MNFKKKKKIKKKNKEKLNSKSFAYLKTEYYQNFEKKVKDVIKLRFNDFHEYNILDIIYMIIKHDLHEYI